MSAGTIAASGLGRVLLMSRRAVAGRNRYLAGAACLALIAAMVMPIVLSVAASLKSTAEAAAQPPLYFPTELSWDSYERLWDYQAGLVHYALNSLSAALLTIVLALVLTITAGFALARLPVPGREIVFIFLLMALIIPYQALLTPMFLMFVKIKLVNTVLGLAILHTTIQLPFSLYIMRNAFEAVPRELEEAAVIDGAGTWQVLTRVLLPAVVPALVTVALFAFITSWNELLGSLVINTDAKAFTLPVVLAAARTETSLGGTDWGMLQAGVTISIIPCIAFYVLLQKYYVSGLTQGALK